MALEFERALAWRFQLRGTAKGTFSPMTLIAWLSIGVGVGTMCALLSVMYGLESALRDSLLRAYPHIVVRPLDAKKNLAPRDLQIEELIQGHPGVDYAVPYLELEMILQSEARALGVVVWGLVDTDLKRLAKHFVFGGIPSSKSQQPEIALGIELADILGVDIGNTLKLISPLRRGGALGNVPLATTVITAGGYRSEHYEFDKQYGFLRLEDAQEISGKGDRITGWQVWTKDIGTSLAVTRALASKLPDWEVKDWSTFNPALFASLKLEQTAMFLILSLAVLIAVMNVAITLMMFVTHKKQNIGILRAMGATQTQIYRVFLLQGAFLGAIGLLIGSVVAVGAILYAHFFYQFPDIYYARSVPVEIRPLSIAVIYLVASALVLVATLYPAWRASKITPLDAIRS